MKKPRFEDVLGHALYLARANKRLSQERLAEMADIDRATLSDVERGVARPNISFFVRLSHALGSAPGAMLDSILDKYLEEGGKMTSITGRMKRSKAVDVKRNAKSAVPRAFESPKKVKK